MSHGVDVLPDGAIEGIKVSKTSAHLFKPTARGTVVSAIEVDPSWGISEAEFSAVAEELNAETVSLERKIAP